MSNNGTFETRFVINCADCIAIALPGSSRSSSQDCPLPGEYYELIQKKRYLVKTLIYPVPNPDFPFLGVHHPHWWQRSCRTKCSPQPQVEGYKKTDFDLRICWGYDIPGFWKLAAKHADEGIQEIPAPSAAAFVHSLQKTDSWSHGRWFSSTHAGVRAQALQNDGKLVDDFDCRRQERCSCLQCPFSSCHFFNWNWQRDVWRFLSIRI